MPARLATSLRRNPAMLPLERDLRDPLGQAKSGPLPGPLRGSFSRQAIKVLLRS